MCFFSEKAVVASIQLVTRLRKSGFYGELLGVIEN